MIFKTDDVSLFFVLFSNCNVSECLKTRNVFRNYTFSNFCFRINFYALAATSTRTHLSFAWRTACYFERGSRDGNPSNSIKHAFISDWTKALQKWMPLGSLAFKPAENLHKLWLQRDWGQKIFNFFVHQTVQAMTKLFLMWNVHKSRRFVLKLICQPSATDIKWVGGYQMNFVDIIVRKYVPSWTTM